jgi:hypothetical protein
VSDTDFDADVLEALVAERARPSPSDAEAKRRVLERVAFSALGLATGGVLASQALTGASGTVASRAAASATEGASSAASSAAKVTWLKLVVVSLVAFAGGVGTHAVYTDRASSPVSSVPMPTPKASTVPSVTASATTSVFVPEVSVSSLPEAPKSQVPTSSASAKVVEPAQLRLRERSLLEAAQAALGRGDAAEALTLVGQHAREFPKSDLGEEREALRIRALARAGRCDEVKSARASFVTRFPASLQRGALERLCP